MQKIIQISAMSFGAQSCSYQCYGILYALTEDGKVYWMREGDDKWYKCTSEAPQEIVEAKPEQHTTTPCPKFRCSWKCRIGYKVKCGAIACRIERHSVEE
jgi:hypothetical protein